MVALRLRSSSCHAFVSASALALLLLIGCSDSSNAPDGGADVSATDTGGSSADGSSGDDVVAPPFDGVYPEDLLSLRIGAVGWALTTHGVYDPDGVPLPLPPSERGNRLSAAWVEADQVWLGYEMGRVYVSDDGGATWRATLDGFVTPDLLVINVSMRRPVPREFLRAANGALYLATFGRGVMRWDEGEDAWVDESFEMQMDGSLHPLAWTVDRFGDGVVGGMVSPRGIVPPELLPILGDAVRVMATPGEGAEQVELVDAVRLPVDIVERAGGLVVASFGGGIWEQADDTWEQVGPEPTLYDVWALELLDDGRLAVLTRAGDVWLEGTDGWGRVRCGGDGQPGADLVATEDGLRIAVGATALDVGFDAVECAARGGARVFLAFSQHTNLYHSYRGDTNTPDGFGKDIRIIRNTIEIFDRHPQFHNDWDIENLFSLDGWLLEHAPDILEDIARRVTDGLDGLRIMSWNNGLMANETRAEMARSIDGARESFEAYVPGLWAPGVQPQENMFTPAHPGIYGEHGIEWITLFHSATSFTGFRPEVELSLAEAHGVLNLTSGLDDGAMKLVPVYHPADIIEHGGLANWLEMLHGELTGDVVLAIHFDADSETWEGIESELEDVEAQGGLEDGWVVPARLQDIVDQLEPAGTVQIDRDLADGAFDGYSSWTEKPQNHRFFTRIVRSRLFEERARALGGDTPAGMEGALDEAFAARMRSLSTTHFGLANPSLHPEREAAGEEATLAAEGRAADALAAAAADAGLAPNSLHNPADGAVAFVLPVDAVSGETLVPPVDSGVLLVESPDGERRWLLGSMAAGGSVVLAAGAPAALETGDGDGEGWGPSALEGMEIVGPAISFDRQQELAETATVESATFPGGVVRTVRGAWLRGGAARYDWLRLDADPGAWWVDVEVTYPTVDEAERFWWDDVVPLAVALDAAPAWTVTRRLQTGEAASYDVSQPLAQLNNHAAHGWVLLAPHGADRGVAVTTHGGTRSAPAFLPLRLALEEDGALQPTLAPFGALWGDLPDHRSRYGLGAGVGEWMTRVTAPQLTATASSWDGRTLRFLLRLQADVSPADYPRLDAARDGVMLLDGEGRPVH